MRGSRKFCQRGSKFDISFYFFLVDDGIEDPNITINWPSSARQRNAILMFRYCRNKVHYNGVSLAGRRWPNIECWLGSFVIFQVGSEPVLLRKPMFFVIFQGGGSGPPAPPPSGSAHDFLPLAFKSRSHFEKGAIGENDCSVQWSAF